MDEPKKRSLSATGGDAAPFVYCDGAVTYGSNHGVIQLELAANIINPTPEGVKPEIIVTAHLRCSPDAARSLIDCLQKALELVSKGGAGAESVPSGMLIN